MNIHIVYLYSFLEDTLINKFSSDRKGNASRTFALLDINRDEMKEEQWYSMNGIYNIVTEEYPEYEGILLREKILFFLTENKETLFEENE